MSGNFRIQLWLSGADQCVQVGDATPALAIYLLDWRRRLARRGVFPCLKLSQLHALRWRCWEHRVPQEHTADTADFMAAAAGTEGVMAVAGTEAVMADTVDTGTT